MALHALQRHGSSKDPSNDSLQPMSGICDALLLESGFLLTGSRVMSGIPV